MVATKETPQARTAGEPSNSVPIAFDRVSLPEIEGWYDPTKQGDVTGRLLGWKKLPAKGTMPERYFVLVQLLDACKGVQKGEKEVLLKPGQTMAITLRAQLMILLEYVDSKPAIQIKSLGKKKLEGGRSMWAFDIGVQKGYRKNPSPAGAVVADNEEDDIPNF